MRIKRLREERGFSLNDLMRRTGLLSQTISDAEKGHRRPQPKTVELLAQALGVTPAYLEYGDKPRREAQFPDIEVYLRGRGDILDENFIRHLIEQYRKLEELDRQSRGEE